MNKKLICVFLLMFVLSGCLNKEAKEVFVTPVTPESNSKFLYQPGTYRAEGSGFHGPIVVEVTVNESSILSIEVISHIESNYLMDIYGNPIGNDENMDDNMGDIASDDEEIADDDIIEIETEEVEVLGAIDSVINMILYEQNANVDVVSHATMSCNGVKEAVSKALAEAML